MNRRTTTRKCHREGKSGTKGGGSTGEPRRDRARAAPALDIGRVGVGLHGFLPMIHLMTKALELPSLFQVIEEDAMGASATSPGNGWTLGGPSSSVRRHSAEFQQV